MNIGLIISPLLSFTGNVAKAIVVPTLTYGIHTVTSQSNTDNTIGTRFFMPIANASFKEGTN